MPYSVNTVADYFIGLAEPETGDVMTHLRLQKLVYYAQGWSLALSNKALFDDRIEAWPHGPVCVNLWNRFKGFRFNPIPREEIASDLGAIKKADRRVLEDVWRVYGQFTAKRLEEMTHSETPWINARGELAPEEKSNNSLKVDDMKDYFSALLRNGQKA